MLKLLHLKNVGPGAEMEMALGERLNLITGDNGLGKSFLLDVAWWALTRKWPHDLNAKLTSGYAARPTDKTQPATITFSLSSKSKKLLSYTSTYSARDESWLGNPGRPPNPGLVVYAHADGGFSVWDPARNYWKKDKGAGVDLQEKLPGYVFSAKEVWDGLILQVDGKDTVVCNGLLRDWPSWIRENGEKAAHMERLLAGVVPPDEEVGVGPLMRISVNDARDIPSVRTAYSDKVPVLFASAGMRRLIGLSYMLAWSYFEHLLAAEQLGEAATENVILLFDESECHLHPRWQRSILSALLQSASVLHPGAKLQLIAATHSPLVLASAEPVFDPRRDAWFDLDLERQGSQASVHLRKRPFVRHGDVSNWLTSDAFDLKSARSLPAEAAMEQARKLLRRAVTPTLQEAKTVDDELRKVLTDIDPFWVRWSNYMDTLRGQP